MQPEIKFHFFFFIIGNLSKISLHSNQPDSLKICRTTPLYTTHLFNKQL